MTDKMLLLFDEELAKCPDESLINLIMHATRLTFKSLPVTLSYLYECNVVLLGVSPNNINFHCHIYKIVEKSPNKFKTHR